PSLHVALPFSRELAPLARHDRCFQHRACRDRVVGRGLDVVDDEVEMHGRPMPVVASRVVRRLRCPGARSLREQVDRRGSPEELDAELAEAPARRQAEGRAVEPLRAGEIVDIDVDQHVHRTPSPTLSPGQTRDSRVSYTPSGGISGDSMTSTTRSPVDPGGLLEFSVVYTDRSLNHMSAAFQTVMRDLSATLKEVYGARSVAIVPGGGTYGMESVARQFATGKRCLVLRNGWFSYRWTQIFEAGAIPSEAIVMTARRTADARHAPFVPAPI